MQLHTKARGFEMTQGLNRFIEDKIRLSLTRFSQQIHSVHVTLSDINGPKGGEDKKCLITVHLGKVPPIVIHHIDSDMYDAISHCCHRAKRNVSRQTDKLCRHKTSKQDHRQNVM